MSEKLDLFEMTIKRGLENHELPMDENAWSAFEANLNSAGQAGSAQSSSSFISKFALAAITLTGVAFFINQSVSTPNIHTSESHAETSTHQHEGHSELESTSESLVFTQHESDSQKTIALHEGDSAAETTEMVEELREENSYRDSQEIKAESSSEKAVLSGTEKDHMNRINEKLQEAANENSDSEKPLKKRSTTRYLGKSFNLGALKSFSPDDDGVKDTFLPSSLQEGDVFVMTISNEAGDVIFMSQEVSKPWRGVDSAGTKLDEGRYAWEVILQKDKKKEIFKGTVRLER